MRSKIAKWWTTSPLRLVGLCLAAWPDSASHADASPTIMHHRSTSVVEAAAALPAAKFGPNHNPVLISFESRRPSLGGKGEDTRTQESGTREIR